MEEQNTLNKINLLVQNTLMTHLGIKFVALDKNSITAKMPINNKTHNPAKILHGGAMMALAESVGSALSYLLIDPKQYDVRGLEINGNHIKSAKCGHATAKATIIHKGKTTHVSEIKITDDNDNLLNISRMTNIIVKLKK